MTSEYILIQDWKSPLFINVTIPKGTPVLLKSGIGHLFPYEIRYGIIKETLCKECVEKNPLWFKKIDRKL